LSDPETSLTTPRLLPLRRSRRSYGNYQSPQSSGSSRNILKRLGRSGRSGRSYGNQALGSFCWTDLRYCQQFKKSDFLELSYKGQVTSAKTLRKGSRSCLVVKYDLLCCFDVFLSLTLFKTQQTHASRFKRLKTHQVQQKLNVCRRIKL